MSKATLLNEAWNPLDGGMVMSSVAVHPWGFLMLVASCWVDSVLEHLSD